MRLMLFLVWFLLFLTCRGSDVIELTEENFDELVADGTWIIKIVVPWCSHCRKVRPVWEELATLLKAEGIHTASIDGSKEEILVSRFETTAFPSFYHLKDRKCREYNGERTVESFAEFARSRYQETEPMPFYRAPNGPVRVFVANARRFPEHVVEIYSWLHDDKQFSKFSILAISLSIPVSIGLGCICLMDCLLTRGHIRNQPRQHQD